MAFVSAGENRCGNFLGCCLATAASYADKYDATQENVSVAFCCPAENVPSATIQGFDESPQAPADCLPYLYEEGHNAGFGIY